MAGWSYRMPSDILSLVESPATAHDPMLDLADLVPIEDLLDLTLAEGLPTALQLAAQPVEDNPSPSPEAPLVGPGPTEPQPATPAANAPVPMQPGAGDASPAFPFGSGHFWTAWSTARSFESQGASRSKPARKRAGTLDDAAADTPSDLPEARIASIIAPAPAPGRETPEPLSAVADFDRTSHGMASGNVATGANLVQPGVDELGAHARVSAVFNGTTTVAVGLGGATIDGYWGQLQIQRDGSFTYVRNSGVVEGDVEYFLYTLTDGTGATSQAVLQIDLLPLVVAAFDAVSNL